MAYKSRMPYKPETKHCRNTDKFQIRYPKDRMAELDKAADLVGLTRLMLIRTTMIKECNRILRDESLWRVQELPFQGDDDPSK